MSKLIDLSGQRFGRWAVLSRGPNNKHGHTMWHCQCDCGRERVVQDVNLRSGNSRGCKSCQTKRLKTTHGLSRTKLYNVWQHIIQRCENPSNKDYKYYGGRGIKICVEWREDFMAFYTWAMANGYSAKLGIDRIDNDGDYEPSNCRFVTEKAQLRNSRRNRLIKIGKETKPISVWAEQTKINQATLRGRLNRGWPERRLLEPVGNI